MISDSRLSFDCGMGKLDGSTDMGLLDNGKDMSEKGDSCDIVRSMAVCSVGDTDEVIEGDLTV